jgi:hypothetical protein
MTGGGGQYHRNIQATINSIRTRKDSRLKPLTKKQLIERAKRSDEDYLTGRFKSQEQLELESENW